MDTALAIAETPLRCTRCREEKPPEAFAINRARACGRQHWCRECFRAYARIARTTGIQPVRPGERPRWQRARFLQPSNKRKAGGLPDRIWVRVNRPWPGRERRDPTVGLYYDSNVRGIDSALVVKASEVELQSGPDDFARSVRTETYRYRGVAVARLSAEEWNETALREG